MVMPLVPSYNTKRIVGTWVRQGGTEMRPGNYKVTVPVRLTNATDDVIIPLGVFSFGALNVTPGLPSLDIPVPCTNDPDNSPSEGWQVLVEVNFSDAPSERYALDVDVTGPDIINLRTLVMTQVFPTLQPVLFRGVPGGIAALDADGDVINADGEKVTGGGGLDEAALEAYLAANPQVDPADIAKLDALPDSVALAASLNSKATDTAVIHTTGAETKNGVLTFGSLPILPTADPTTANQAARKAYVDAQIAAAVAGLINGAPGALDALNELAAAMGNDAAFSTTVTNALALKAPLASPALTGNPTAPTAAAGDNDTTIATTAFVRQERPAMMFLTLWNGTGWEYNGAVITARPAGMKTGDRIMFVGNPGGTVPAWAATNDIHTQG